MTKISQLTDIGTGLAPDDEFVIRDVSDGSTPNKKVTASGFFVVASALGLSGLDRVTAGSVATGTQTRVYASGISGYSETTISGIPVARTTISGYFENASGTVGGVLFPVVTQTDIGSAPNQVPLNGMLGSMAFQDASLASLGTISVDQFSNVPLLTGGGIKFPPTQVASADPNTLDDYEEGTWTAAITALAGGTQTYTMTSSTASYTKIGNVVKLSGRLEFTYAAGGAPSSTAQINLPIAAGSASYQYRSSSVVATFGGTVGLTRETATSATFFANLSTASGGVLLDFTYIIGP
jgi:hypothetical protein